MVTSFDLKRPFKGTVPVVAKSVYTVPASKIDVLKSIMLTNTTPGGAVPSGTLLNMYTWCFDASGNMYFINGSNRIYKADAQGFITFIAGSGTSATTDGTGAAAALAGSTTKNLLINSAGTILYWIEGNRIRKCTVPGGVVSLVAGSATSTPDTTNGTGAAAIFEAPVGLTLDNADTNLYCVSTRTGSVHIRKIVAATGVVTNLTSTANTVGKMKDLILSPDGLTLYAVGGGSSTNRSILQVAIASPSTFNTAFIADFDVCDNERLAFNREGTILYMVSDTRSTLYAFDVVSKMALVASGPAAGGSVGTEGVLNASTGAGYFPIDTTGCVYFAKGGALYGHSQISTDVAGYLYKLDLDTFMCSIISKRDVNGTSAYTETMPGRLNASVNNWVKLWVVPSGGTPGRDNLLIINQIVAPGESIKLELEEHMDTGDALWVEAAKPGMSISACGAEVA